MEFQYCEAIGGGSPVQPLNIASSLPFLLLAWFCWSAQHWDRGIRYVAAAGWTLTGWGSVGWHATLNPGLLAIDVAGVTAVGVAIVRAAQVRFWRIRSPDKPRSSDSWVLTGVLSLLLGGVSIVAGQFGPGEWQMAPAFVPGMLVMAALAIIAGRGDQAAGATGTGTGSRVIGKATDLGTGMGTVTGTGIGRSTMSASILWIAAVAFGLAILARGADVPLCDLNPYGTHPLWHLLAGAAAWLALRGILGAKRG